MNSKKKIGFQLLGNDNWLGGIYYISNIINAILSLPANKRPEICLIVSPWIDEKHFTVLADKIEVLVYPSKNSLESKHKLIHKVARKLRQIIGSGYDYMYAKYLSKKGVSILYPTLSSLTKNFPIEWIAWVPDYSIKSCLKTFQKNI